MNPTAPTPRQVYMVLSPRSLPYARLALDTLLRNSVEDINLHLITDSDSDGNILTDLVNALNPPSRHTWSVTSESELLDLEADRFGVYENLRSFRHGHPCWRKVTDPMLLSCSGDELVLLDPDLYFPNIFRFEETPATGLLLMWQKPNCLLPPEIVRRAMDANIRLADHVDIGVSHWRAGADLEWIDWLLGKLGGSSLPLVMHIEAIVWAAIAMRMGGGYLDRKMWCCWRRTQLKRILRRLGVDGAQILRIERWRKLKCFHGGGEAKWWLEGAQKADVLRSDAKHLEPGEITPFKETTRLKYEREQTAKGLLRNLGYYRLMKDQ